MQTLHKATAYDYFGSNLGDKSSSKAVFYAMSEKLLDWPISNLESVEGTNWCKE